MHDAKLQLLKSILPANPVEAVRGQYESQKEVDNDISATETYAALTLFSQDNDWQGVPLRYYRQGYGSKNTEICVYFGGGNQLQFRMQPDEGIRLSLEVKSRGCQNKNQ